MIRLRDLMSRNVICTTPDEPVRDAARTMEANALSLLPVCENQRLVGVLSYDAVEAWRARRNPWPGKARVRQLMKTDFLYGCESQDMREVVRLMRENEIRTLPVLDPVRRLVGIYSFGL
jgi:CBS domain-containing protein